MSTSSLRQIKIGETLEVLDFGKNVRQMGGTAFFHILGRIPKVKKSELVVGYCFAAANWVVLNV